MMMAEASSLFDTQWNSFNITLQTYIKPNSVTEPDLCGQPACLTLPCVCVFPLVVLGFQLGVGAGPLDHTTRPTVTGHRYRLPWGEGGGGGGL